MLSHTVPKKLLEQFTYDDPVTKSKRLWRHEKDKVPYWKASPKTATRWNHHFAHPTNSAKEAELEDRLNREFENPVNEFLELIGYRTFHLTSRHIRLLAGYMRMLFNRTRARQAASAISVKAKNDAYLKVINDEAVLAQIAAKLMRDAVDLGYGVDYLLAVKDVKEQIEARITKSPTPDEVQQDYIQAIETMMAFEDDGMLNGQWGILQTPPENPFVIGDAPVVTFERTEENRLYFGIGFARPNVEAFLPVSPTTCLHVLPAVARTRQPRRPATVEVNMAQAAFATNHCFANVNNPEINAVLQDHFGRIQLGITGFNINHFDAAQTFVDMLGKRAYTAQGGR